MRNSALLMKIRQNTSYKLPSGSEPDSTTTSLCVKPGPVSRALTPTLFAARSQKQYVLPGSRLLTVHSGAAPWYTCLRSSCSESAISKTYSVMSDPPSTGGGPAK